MQATAALSLGAKHKVQAVAEAAIKEAEQPVDGADGVQQNSCALGGTILSPEALGAHRLQKGNGGQQIVMLK